MLRVRVLGDLTIELNGSEVEPPTSRRARALLGWLAVDRRLHPRPQLAARFWPDVLDESARTSLRSALAALRRSLGPEADRYLVATRERAGLTDKVETDVAELERLREAGRLEEAVGLWRGDLLSGLDDDWVLVARDEWRQKIGGLLGELATRAQDAGDVQAALAYTRRMVALDPLSEEAHRALMSRLAATGDRAAALVAYNRYADRLRAELRIAPSAATRALAEQMRGGGKATEVIAGSTEAPRSATGTVTLLFTDLVRSTELLDDLGDDQAEQLRRVHFGLLRDVALSHAGQEVKNLGDGLMVAFASSLDAAACAIGIQQAVERHNRREQSVPLSVRIGLHVGEPIRDADDYFGSSVVVAKRLCDSAEGGQILVSELVRLLIGGRGSFSFRPRGELSLKGFFRPVGACELGWEPVGEQRIPLPAELRRFQGAFVGRLAEIAAVGKAWRDVHDGQAQAVVVAGDPGIGKTRLVAEFCASAHDDGAAVLLGASTEETLAPYQPFIQALRHYVASCPPDELLLQVGTRRAILAQLVPELAGAHARAVRSRAEIRGEGERYALFDAVASLLREVALTRPLILVLDDLHWADDSTLMLLRHVARAVRDAPLLILGTYRDTEVPDDHPLLAALAELRRARALTSVSLGGLDTDHVAVLIQERGAQLAEGVVHGVARRTEGNPFFVEEVVRQIDRGLELALPETVKDLLLRRLRRLDEPARQTLAAGAVLGAEIELAVLERMIEADTDELLELMELALAERVLVESPDAVGRYMFVHALIRETIYEQLSATRRARLHLRAGRALEALKADRLDEYAEQLAHHFAQAGDDAKGFEYRPRAAEAAARVHATQAAIAHYDAALETGGRLGLSAATDERMRGMLVERGWLRYVSGETEGHLADFASALEAARSAGDRRLEADALDRTAFTDKLADVGRAETQHREALAIAEELGDVQLQIRVLSRLSLVLSNQLDLEGALGLGGRALQLARRTSDEHDRALAMDALKLAALQLGESDRLLELTSELEAIERQRGELWYLQWTLLESAFAPLARAEWDAAHKRLADTIAINTRIDDRVFRALVHDATGWLERSRGNYEQALAEGRSAVELAATGERDRWSAWTRATFGWTLLELRSAHDAVEVLEEALAASELLSDRFRAAGHLAWARALAGDRGAAASAAGVADEALSRLKAPSGGAFLFGFAAIVALARAELAAERPERVDALLLPVCAAARRLGWHEADASASLVLGLSQEARDSSDNARVSLTRAVEVSREHGLLGVEWEACAALGLQAESDAIIERLARGVGDDRRADQLVQAAQR
jgi:class 3 adenylate cyclase